MKRENEKHPVISLSGESFKHYLINRYGEHVGDYAWKNASSEWAEPVPSETLNQLYNRAKTEIENSGGSLMSYAVVDDELVNCGTVDAPWPDNCMWVLQFNND
ncbi:hypothetical protein DYBT9623_04552 [Dyadobacter sp. CECT 9623]|uniref:Uncharacterized protein n=1 Tax=Dyadobacter linearis TaxID=2823330 RepID=A0ABM8UW88_9BACT|nr:hypothetical protein [Dyadobacter sp. CECT 9623]CAG5073024.1 hypothetical protein DYBT9623_04552 [Dyadobacter sp. CECT 9623]